MVSDIPRRIFLVVENVQECRPTTKFSDRTPTFQHAGAPDLLEQSGQSPAAEHFMCPGSLQRLVGRHVFVDSSRSDRRS